MVYRTIQGAHLAYAPTGHPHVWFGVVAPAGMPGHTWHTRLPDTHTATQTAAGEKGADARAGHSPVTNCVTNQAVSEKKEWELGRLRASQATRPHRTPRPVAGLSNFAERSRYRRAAAVFQ